MAGDGRGFSALNWGQKPPGGREGGLLVPNKEDYKNPTQSMRLLKAPTERLTGPLPAVLQAWVEGAL